MVLKDIWTPQDDTMVADPEVVNIIADAVIKNEEDIKDLKENGGGGGVSQEYVDNALLPKIEMWQPNKNYTEGQIVFGTWENKGYMQSAILECIVPHRSFGNSAYLAPDYWKALSYLSAHFAYTAVMDENGNAIIRTYATKEELENFTSNEKVYDYSSETTNDLILEHNSLYYFSVLTTLRLAISSDVNIESVDVPFECSIMFTSGETATNLDYSASPIIWSGDDCDSDGHFVPEANKTYEISIKKFGLTISARVGVI